MKYRIVLIAMFNLCLQMPAAYGCQPPNYPKGYVPPTRAQEVTASFDKADAVFIGEVSAVGPDKQQAKLQAGRVIKGIPGTPPLLYWSNTHMNCGPPGPLVKGNRGIYFVQADGHGGRYYDIIVALPDGVQPRSSYSEDALEVIDVLNKLQAKANAKAR